MRKYDFEKYRKEIKKRYYRNFELLEPARRISRRPRKKEDLELLSEMAQARLRRWVETGKLKVVGERRYKLEI